MHPEIRQQGPGTCPKCGMALEPVTFSVEEKNEELIDMSRRFWVCTVLALPVFFLAMIASAAMSVSSVSVIGNSLRLKRVPL